MIKLSLNKTYINSWNIFSRAFLINFNFCEQKKLLIFDTEKDVLDFIKIYNFLFKEKVIYINNFNIFLFFNFSTEGIFITTKEIFEWKNLSDFELQKNIIKINLNQKIIINDLINDLINFWYSHSLFLSKEGAYNLEWDLLNIRPFFSEKIYKISVFWSSVDKIIEINWKNINNVDNLILFSNKDKFNSLKNNNSFILQNIKNCIIFFIWLDFFPQINDITKNTNSYINFSYINQNNWELDLNIKELSINNLEDLKNLLKIKSNKINIYTKNIQTIKKFLNHHNFFVKDIYEIYKINLQSFFYKDKFFICDDILENIFIKQRHKKPVSKNINLLLHIKQWDFVVHKNHWVWIFKQVLTKEFNEIKREYIEIEYKDNDKLFVPIQELYRVSKYIWLENPKLTNLNTKEWDSVLKNTEEEIKKIAEDLLQIYAKKTISTGFSFLEYKQKENIFRNAFKYKYTQDQEQCIFEVLEDMSKQKPMDRLLTWDVWFGKTEVACNAVYRAFLNQKQSIFISPLITLAYDHYDSLKNRFNNFWLKIDILTRLTTQKEEIKILNKLKNWEINCIIWTHKLLSKKIKFYNLWLLIIDEEHKFWVLDKELINKTKVNIDVLSLSATPIPRSLNFALSWVKDISIISSPPPSKKPIKTFILKYDDDIIKKAILKEFDRSGQVIYLHNKISSLNSIQKYLQNLIWIKAKIISTFSKMSWLELESNIIDFKNQKYNILLTTTVIENWVNFLNANTIIIDEANNFWLSQLHQLRWRIWRKDKEWFCYLLYKKDLHDDEKKRLITIATNSHLWAGFEIALRDLQIRWAWDILWIKQSWKSSQIWLSLYLELLEEKIKELKDWDISKKIDCKIELDISYYISDDFFQNEIDKLNFFRNIESIETIEDLDFSYKTFIEWNDKVPKELDNLFLILKIRLILSQYWVINLKKVLNNYIFEFDKNTTVEKIRSFLEFDKSKNFIIITIHKIKVNTEFWKNDLDFLKNFT